MYRKKNQKMASKNLDMDSNEIEFFEKLEWKEIAPRDEKIKQWQNIPKVWRRNQRELRVFVGVCTVLALINVAFLFNQKQEKRIAQVANQYSEPLIAWYYE